MSAPDSVNARRLLAELDPESRSARGRRAALADLREALRGRVTQIEAAAKLGVSRRTLQRALDLARSLHR